MKITSLKIETIDFKKFMKGEYRKNKATSPLSSQLNSFIPVHPAMFVDSTFIMVGVGVVLVALLERTLANHGHVAIAEAMHTILKMAFPIVGFAAMWFLVKQITFM